MKNFTLITGASGGIGLELARLCAKNKQNLIVVARSEKTLIQLANDLTEKFSVEVLPIVKDLSNPNAPNDLFQEITQKKIAVDILINNAGFGDHGYFPRAPINKINEMIQLNVTNLTLLTHLFIQDMLKNKKGKILNVASVASFQPGPFMAVYYATKSFVLSFSEALAEEVENSNITVTALCPGPTISGFQDAANMKNIALMDSMKWPSSKEVAEYGFRAMMKGQRVAIHGLANQFAVQLIKFIPRSWVVKIVRRLQEKRF